MPVEDLYFDWLQQFVLYKEYDNPVNIEVIEQLYLTEFRWILDRDENRAGWGLALRDQFYYETGQKADIFTEKCTVLEMLIALAIDMDNILYDDRFGPRIYVWFWMFLENLGVKNGKKCHDLDEKLDIFMDRKYSRNGKGNIIRLQKCKKDVTKVEIWFQICWFIDEILE